ncbi:DUF6528 family protein [Maribellus sp. YY47]|uniref:DUF6528 family protein n=1 Tax=Maribellus sp. YY47 TaxID=2929486 RepID=UPI0020016E26|nr:DUF6528 family protein [Maribellus sp. YY47]MCK3685553.1 DUF6528 family protein [Maribellus sp. YY47]
MKIKSLIIFPLLAGFVFCTSAKKEVSSEIIACGGHDIIIFDEEHSNGTDLKITWRWNIEEAKELPTEYQKYLNPLDECKPIDGNSKILATSSGGGVVLLDRATKNILFYANAPMAHSAELLPGNRIVVALSDHPYGNSIEVFDIATPEKCIYRDALKWGHGVVWMPKQKRLYALGSDDLVCYSLKNWDTNQPELKREKTWTLPEWGGHDLLSISDNELVITVAESVWNFSIDSEKFEAFEPISAVDLKSVNYNKTTGKLVYTKAEEEWWTHNIYSVNPDKKYTIPDINVYKARVYPQ